MSAMDYSRVARWYDLYVRTEFDVPFFLDEVQGSRRVLELTSGTGRLSIPLLKNGAPLTCVDSSPDMLAILKEKLNRLGLAAIVHEMDICNLTLEGPFDRILIPFHAFTEIVDHDAQHQALTGIGRLLSEDGKFICTLHNPVVRLRSIDGKLMQYGEFPIPNGGGVLSLSASQRYDVSSHIVSGAQFYEIYGPDGQMRSKSMVGVRFYLHEKEEFEKLVDAAGFRILELYGDYSRSPFDPERSPFMIWGLGKCNIPV